MNNDKLKYKKLPKDTKFATFGSGKEDDILMEILIANLIHNGSSLKMLLNPVELVENKKDKEELKKIITNIILDFINLNPKYVDVLKQNDMVDEFLHSLGLNL
jgi:chemotaxis regulatin CheY-phosphate phosphatase CheZ